MKKVKYTIKTGSEEKTFYQDVAEPEELREIEEHNERVSAVVRCSYRTHEGHKVKEWRRKEHCIKDGLTWIPKIEFCMTHLGSRFVSQELEKIYGGSDMATVVRIQADKAKTKQYRIYLESLTMAAAMKAGIPYQPLDVEALENERLATKVKKQGVAPTSEMVEKESPV